MAEAFAPSIGMDIGASNVSVKSGTAIDLSFAGKALGSMFEKPEATKLTEAEIKRQMWQPAAAVLKRIEEDPSLSKVEKKIKTNKVLSSFVNDNPTLASEATSYLGFQEDVEINTMSPLDRTIMDWEETPDNKDLSAGFRIKAMNPDGSVDEAKYNRLVVDSISIASRAKELENVSAINKVEGMNTWQNSPEEGFQSFVSFASADASQLLDAEMVTSGLISAGQSSVNVTAEAIQDNFVIPMINKLGDKSRQTGELMDRAAIALKIDISSEEYKAQKALALAPYTNKIDYLNTNKDNFAAFTERLKVVREALQTQEGIDAVKATKLIKQVYAKYVGAEVAEFTFSTPEGRQAYANQLVSSNKEDLDRSLLDFKEMSKGKKGVGDIIVNGLTMDSTQQSYIQMYTPQTMMGPDGDPFNSDVTVLSKEEEEKYKAYPTVQKANIVNSGIALMSRMPSLVDENIPYAMDIVGKTLNLSLMTDAPRLEVGQVKAFYTPDYFTFSQKIEGKIEPKAYEGYVNKADASVQMQLTRDWKEFQSQLRVIENALGGGKIFGVGIVNGKYVPTFVQNFDKTNPELRKKMMYEKITTPEELIKAYTRGVFGGGSKVDPVKLNSSLESINYLSTELIKLPQELVGNFSRSYGYSKEQMGVFNSEVPISNFESSVEVAKVEPKISEEFKGKVPQLMEYYDLKNKFIASDNPQERATISQSLNALKQTLGMQTKSEARDPSAGSSRNPWDLSFPDGKTDRAIEQLYQAKVSERMVNTASGQNSAPMSVDPAAETQGQAFAPKRIKFSDLVAGQTGGR